MHINEVNEFGRLSWNGEASRMLSPVSVPVNALMLFVMEIVADLALYDHDSSHHLK